MRWQTFGSRTLVVLVVAAATALVLSDVARAQTTRTTTGTTGTTGTTRTTTGTTTTGTTRTTTGTTTGGTGANANITTGQSGVLVDAQGTLQMRALPDLTGMLRQQRLRAAQSGLPQEIARTSNLRKVSLNRLEKAIAARGGVVTEEMSVLAGLLRLQYVFFYPETGDIVIAGPAEGWLADPTIGRVLGLTTLRPVLQLQDLVVALRAFPPDQTKTPMVGCSIDPTDEGLASMQRFLRTVGSRATPNDTQFIVNGLRSSLGMQTVRVDGIPADTHFAHVMVEADYRMKLIGIGLENPPVPMKTFIQAASPGQVARNALIRWYFVPDYQCVRSSEDGLAMELVGEGVKLVGENELVSATGERSAVGGENRASKVFSTSFTARYSQLARVSPVYAELRNLIDMLIASAYIQQEDMYHKAGWEMPLLGNEQSLPVRTYPAPSQVASAVAAKWNGNQLMTPIGGGVRIEPAMAVSSGNRLPDEGNKVSAAREQTQLNLAEGQWWWD